MLSPEIIAAALPSKILGQSLFVFDALPSTNTFALEIARNPTPQGTVVLADRQTAGRGRLQRSWFSPPNANIYGSLILSFTGHFQCLGWVPLMAGTAIAQAIEDSTTINITLKWPNDILIDEQKIGGILCESFKQDSTKTCVVIGFGINVNLTASSFPMIGLALLLLDIRPAQHLLSPIGHRQFVFEAAHLSHILFMVQRNNHGATSQEQ